MLIQILLAIYNPDISHFKNQLLSLNSQSYKEIEVICCDDCSDNQDDIYNICNNILTKIKWTYIRNDKNIGCNKAFEKLINCSTAQFLAFCDQDDIWNEDKIECLYEMIESTGATLVYSDLMIINEDGVATAQSIRTVRKRLKHVSGEDLWSQFLRKNSITGCTILMRSEVAKAAIPFPVEKTYVWDHWLAINSAHHGMIAYYPKPLVKYRIHDHNLVGIKKLVGICDKHTYISNRLDCEIESLTFAINSMNLNDSELSTASKLVESVKIRKRFLSFPTISQLYNFMAVSFRDPLLLLLELVLAFSPDNGTAILKFVKKTSF